jgi:HWE histidine kinase
VRDITERKEREERELLLIREMNHRIKNILTVVDAIAHRTAAEDPEDFAERFSERIRALSANHDLLFRNEWTAPSCGSIPSVRKPSDSRSMNSLRTQANTGRFRRIEVAWMFAGGALEARSALAGPNVMGRGYLGRSGTGSAPSF